MKPISEMSCSRTPNLRTDEALEIEVPAGDRVLCGSPDPAETADRQVSLPWPVVLDRRLQCVRGRETRAQREVFPRIVKLDLEIKYRWRPRRIGDLAPAKLTSARIAIIELCCHSLSYSLRATAYSLPPCQHRYHHCRSIFTTISLVLDANANRAEEGLRVIEEYVADLVRRPAAHG